MKYTPETVERIIKALEIGHTRVDACLLSDVNPDTFYMWLKDTDKPEFKTAVEKAERKLLDTCIKIVLKGSLEDPRLALEMLSRRFHKTWGLHIRNEIIPGVNPELEEEKRKERVTKRLNEILQEVSANGKDGGNDNSAALEVKP